MRPPIHIHFWQGRERTEGHRWACYRPYRIDLIGRGAPQRIAEYPAHERPAAVAHAVRLARAEGLPITLYNADIKEAEAPGVRLIRPPPFRSRILNRPRPASGIDAPAACRPNPCPPSRPWGRSLLTWRTRTAIPASMSTARPATVRNRASWRKSKPKRRNADV